MSESGQWCVTKDRRGGFSAHPLEEALREVNAAVVRGREPEREVIAVVDSLNAALKYRRVMVRAVKERESVISDQSSVISNGGGHVEQGNAAGTAAEGTGAEVREERMPEGAVQQAGRVEVKAAGEAGLPAGSVPEGGGV